MMVAKLEQSKVESVFIERCRTLGKKYLGIAGEFRGSATKARIWCERHRHESHIVYGNAHRSYLCKLCGYADGRGKSDEETRSSFVGFEEGTTFRRSSRKRHWITTCPTCSKDEYTASGVCTGEFESHSGSLRKGHKACRCAPNYRWTKAQREYQVRKLCAESDISFISWSSDSERVINADSAIFNCRTHGEFIAKVNDFIHDENRCPSCAIPGFKPFLDGHVYALKSDCGAYLKIGISNYPDTRIQKLTAPTPFKFEVMKVFRVSGHMAQEIERDTHNAFESAGMRGFDGATEWLKYDPAILKYVEKRAL